MDRNFTQNNPAVTVIICTRNRGDNVLLTARAVLAGDYHDFEMLIMDQSDDDATQDAILPLCDTDARVRYFRLELPGKPGALNRAAQEARGRYLVLTDDDCDPDPHWISALLAPLEADPAVGAVFGDVRAAPHDNVKGYIPDNPIAYRRTIHSLRDYLKMPKMVNFGIGANMAVRAETVQRVRGWDPCIGPGSKFGNADDHDMTVRVLLAGYAVAFTPDARTVHLGYRLWSESAKDVAHTAYGFGAAFIKYLRCGKIYYGSLRMLSYFLWQIAWRGIRWQRPLGIAFPKGWLRGLLAAVRYPVDRSTFCFVKMDASESRKYGQEFAQVVRRTQQGDLVETTGADAAPAAVGAAHSEEKR